MQVKKTAEKSDKPYIQNEFAVQHTVQLLKKLTEDKIGYELRYSILIVLSEAILHYHGIRPWI